MIVKELIEELEKMPEELEVDVVGVAGYETIENELEYVKIEDGRVKLL